jgi:protocatechuate 3,4-dioxygenase beta subunit
MFATKPPFSRRQALAALAGSGAAALTTRQAFAQASPEKLATILPSNVCIITPQAVEGPYYFDPKLVGSDITEKRPGVPMKMMLQVVEAADCAAIQNARVDVWHCDATGHYSGYTGQGDEGVSTEGQQFLRGTQMTDRAGIATFSTIYPGWYRGRTVHIHFKVFLDQKSVLVGQMYFPDALSEYIYRNVAPYSQRTKARDTVNIGDSVLRQSGGGHESFASIKEDKESYVASLVLGVNRNATPQASGPGAPPPGGQPLGGQAAQSAPAAPSSLVPAVK